ncbi:AI-2E family transporter [Phaeobacter sp. QD34_3]|uniref:AI-2E family transporter n=1 Tax=unclassified Phaeobacter TaxID=2621772 RepID=UPI00237F2D9C|nr:MULTISPECIES: AI-2E family transporter [unclassified Phaeobacter]MDE4134597.1 AI-2E family transporter [Phaeobacter sp. QD34_3]MDE4138256.1 AI-2E family transporter [Phaeobacter sp. QD34_24]
MSRLALVTYSLALLLMVGWLLTAGQAILLPILIAIIAVYILTTAAEVLSGVPIIGHLPRTARRLLVLLAILAAFMVLASFITASATAISAALPTYAANLDKLQHELLTYLGVDEVPSWANLGESLLDLIDATTLMPAMLATISNGGTLIVGAALYAVFILTELDRLPEKTLMAMRDPEDAAHTLELARKINDKIGGYLAAKTLVNVILGLISYAILLALGIAHPAFWAILIGLLNYIPYIGSIIAVFFPVTISLIQFGSFGHAALALVALMTPQMIIGYYMEPKYLGQSVNLSPFSVLLALALWTELWGMTGAILAVPLTAMVMIILAEIPTTRWIAVMMSENGRI